MFRFTTGLFSVACSTLLFASSALATPVTYTFNDGTFFPRIYDVGGNAAEYDFRFNYDLSGLSLTLDAEAGTAQIFGNASGDIAQKDGTIIGSASSTLDLRFTGIDFDPSVGNDNVLALGVQGESTSSGSFFFDLSFNDGRREAETIDVWGGFASVNANHGTLGDLAGTSFNFLLRDNGQFDIWVKSHDGQAFTISNDPFNLHGDIHGTAEVPEPATVLLLGSALLGLSRKRTA